MPLIKENIFGPLEAAGYTYDVYAHTYLLDVITNPRSGEHDAAIDAKSLERELPQAVVEYSGVEEIDSLYRLSHLLVNGDPWCVACACMHACMHAGGCKLHATHPLH